MARSLLGIFVFAVSGWSAPFTSLLFFGDSLSDTGNVYQTTSLFNTVTLGLIPVLPESPPYYNGRFSNGPLWTEQVAQRLGHNDDATPAGMSLGVFGSLPSTGQNYAIGGARTAYGGALGILDPLIPTGILAQTEYYLSRVNSTADPNALYFLLGGGNDLLAAAEITDPDTRTSSAIEASLYLVVSAYTLYTAGARNIFIVNAPNIGMVPDSIANNRTEAGEQASVVFNYVLDYYVGALGALPSMNIMYFDLFGFYNNIIADTLQGGIQYGFTSLTPCINPGPGVPSCDTAVFFDEVHPTTRVHALFGDRAADQILGQGAQAALFAQADVLAAPVPVPEPSSTVAGVALLLLFVGKRLVRKA